MPSLSSSHNNANPTIQKHESGTVHKNNVERFLSDVYKKGRQDKKDAESVRRELQRIEKAALKSMGETQSSSTTTTTTTATITTKAPAPRPPSTSVPYYKQSSHMPPPPTLESLAFKTPGLQGREEWALPKETAMIGQWQTVSTHQENHYERYIGKKRTTTEQETTTHDQAPEFQDDDDEPQEDLNEFKIKEKEYPVDDEDTLNQSTTIEGSSLFKKRKLTGQNSTSKKRNIRKKD
ncbi:uncharacterized protein BX664DRAFT_359633 [Halteromyces radiatus]|uniref:uncharacterized protein n=1 Tax=Halteromyces radiatus TaxID=101107 RepID=UPI00221EDD43|nr:uncharacterized protein BX664DRAFT_359633 [Halteromyces radiatus]KAI8086074.1 hypothetical protein BX664DRAFT_359633 [Halteromyces radiatus]